MKVGLTNNQGRRCGLYDGASTRALVSRSHAPRTHKERMRSMKIARSGATGDRARLFVLSGQRSATAMAERACVWHTRGPARGGIDGEGTNAQQQGIQKTEVGQAKGIGVRLQEVARAERPGFAGAGQEILSGRHQPGAESSGLIASGAGWNPIATLLIAGCCRVSSRDSRASCCAA
jgi:hypothetical protein